MTTLIYSITLNAQISREGLSKFCKLCKHSKQLHKRQEEIQMMHNNDDIWMHNFTFLLQEVSSGHPQ